MTVKELREKRAALAGKARELLDAADNEKRSLTTEEQTRYDGILADIETVKADLDRREKLETEERELEASNGRKAPAIVVPERKNIDEFRSWLTGETREANARFNLGTVAYRGGNFDEWQKRALSSTATAGAELIPEGFVSSLEKALMAFGGVRSVASSLRTSSGNDLPWPMVNDTDNEGELIGENDQRTEQDAEFSKATLKAYTYSSKAIRVPFELLQDSAINLDAELGAMLGERIARITNRHFTNGTGTDQPQGIVTGATAGKVQSTLGAITYDELVDFEHSVDPAYRRGAVFMFNDTTLRELKKLRDDDGALIWQQSMRDGEPSTILGYRYVINQDMPDLDEADAKSIIFGDTSKYKVRDVLGITLIRLTERYADFGQVGFMAHSRHDGLLLNAGTHPVRAFVNASA